ncbi:uncharacterized protein LOC132036323 isoform X1 [Lycium ferocissimum]|uniref:uncharacterized protein LOC132036323 isoform X1 n=1 Tax=Lycium ferocissimum TaxID=112874 RepID=UPI0028163F5A|nr:uncharacterized protein LOC132036323 isoform X1 [Lycium ferocissimum]
MGTYMVVEHLQCSMSKDLLCKFPDNSAFDFDYTQSSIWSPLVPRPLSSYRRLSSGLSRKLSYKDVSVGCIGAANFKKVTTKIKRKLSNAVTENLRECHRLKKRKKAAFDFTRLPSSSKLASTTTTPRKQWCKVLKAATKHFKKRNNKKDSTGDINFCRSLTDNSLLRSSTYP